MSGGRSRRRVPSAGSTRGSFSATALTFGEPTATDELEDVRWHPIGRQTCWTPLRDVTQFMLARAIALRSATASGDAPLFYWAKNARRIGVCREAFGTT